MKVLSFALDSILNFCSEMNSLSYMRIILKFSIVESEFFSDQFITVL